MSAWQSDAWQADIWGAGIWGEEPESTYADAYLSAFITVDPIGRFVRVTR